MTDENLKTLLSYDPETGLFAWAVKRKGAKGVGKEAGTVTRQGYRVIVVNSVWYRAHRLAWLFVHGKWPENEIDHINGNKLDNRIANLRDVSHKVNIQNQRKARANNRSGMLGVHKYRDGIRWVAQIGGTAKHHIGVFDTPEAAKSAYLEAKRAQHEGCTL